MSLRSTMSAKLLAGISALWFALFPLFAYGVSSVEGDPTVDSESAIPDDSAWYSLHGQATYILQYKNKFNSPYVGDKSLLSTGDVGKSYTVTVTPFIGVRPWKGTEFFYNPEAAEGMPFSNLSGLGGFTNGEMQRGNLVPMQFYNARAFIRQTIGLGGGVEHIEDGPNQIKGDVDKRRVTLTYGWLSALDYFDSNRYSHDPRTQFLNWSIMAAGAYDFAANGRGYTYGVVGEYFDEGWTVRLARLAMPKDPNGMSLDYQLTKQYGDQVEVEREHNLFGQEGAFRALLFQNRGILATFNDAVNQAQQTGVYPPNILTSRNGYQNKWGYVLNAEQAVLDDIGLFVRWSWNNGQSETEAFTDISRSLSAGTSVKGSFWGRPDDTYGLAFSFNGISSSQINYLNQGGSSMFIGDGKIAYQGERIMETYYSVRLFKGAYLSADYQYIRNPAYNSDRGPVSFFAMRAHFEL